MKSFICALAFVLASAAAHAAEPADKTLRWSSAGDVLSFDFHAVSDTFSTSVGSQIYETLVRRAKDTSLEPALAHSWEVIDPLRWRFRLRQGVKFHDGSLLTADDVVFSVERSQHANASNRALTTRLGRPKKVDAHTVDFELESPNPVLLEGLQSAAIMSKAWCEKHGAVRPQAYSKQEETHAVRHAMGTGPYRLETYEPGVQTVLVSNSDYWGKAAAEGNVARAVYRPIANPATRIAALVSGEIDFVLDPPPQDVSRLRTAAGIRIVEGPEWRALHLGFDQFRDELQHSNVKGKNPFKDKRVRQAFYRAIDVETLRSKVMLGAAKPTGSIAFADGSSAPDTETRLPFDAAAARRLLAEAGYPQGFEVRLDCPNNRYINDERICVAISAMLAKVGVRAPVHAEPMATFSPRLDRHEPSFYLIGIGGSGRDPQTALTLVAHSLNATNGDGRFNTGRFADAELDRLIDGVKVEMDKARREAMIRSALIKLREEVYLIPLHRQMLPWAMRSNVSVVHTPFNTLVLRWVRISEAKQAAK